MLMQSYRRAYTTNQGNGRLSQEGLLRLMGQVDPRYFERYNHSTVARWESGATRPTRERLEVFGRALNLTNAEIEGMVRLAGISEDEASAGTTEALPIQQANETAPTFPVTESDIAAPVKEVQTYASRVVRYSLTRLALPGLVVAGSGYLLASLGWNASWIMLLYVNLAMGLILVQSFLKLRQTSELRELFFVSVFFLLGGKILLAPVLRMDPYGFYAIGNLGGTPIPYLLAIIANLLLALVAGLMFEFLWRWQYASNRGASSAFGRAGWVAFPPLALVYLIAILCSPLGTWIYLLLVFSVLGAATMTLLMLRDQQTSFNEWERRLLLQAAVVATIVLAALGGVAAIVIYLEPSFLSVPDHTLLRSWSIDFEKLGYSMDELMDRYRIGAAWSALAILVYMVIAIGGSLLVAIHGMDTKKEDGHAAERMSKR